MQVDFFPPSPARALPSSARRAAQAGAIVFLLPWDGTHGAAHDAARTAPRLTAQASSLTTPPELGARRRTERAHTEPGWVHQAFTPLPTEGFLALRAATSAYRKGA